MRVPFLFLPEARDAHRTIGLDLARCLAILCVVFAHGSVWMPASVQNVVLFNGGFLGVEMFFVLSGFLIGGILLKAFNEPHVGPQTLYTFWGRRWFRTLPNYFLFLLLNLTVFPWLFQNNSSFDARYWAFLQNLAWPCPPLMNESWSLAIEEWFYLTLPFIFFLFVRHAPSRKNAILTCILAYILVFTGARTICALDVSIPWDAGLRKVVIYRLDSIGYGTAMAFVSFYHGAFFKRHARPLFFLGSILVLITLYQLTNAVLHNQLTRFDRFGLFSVTSLGLALLLPGMVGFKINGARTAYLISHISLISYSMYLIHVSFAVPTVRTFLTHQVPFYPVTAFLAYLAVTLVLSTVVYKVFEKPMTALRDTPTLFTSRSRKR